MKSALPAPFEVNMSGRRSAEAADGTTAWLLSAAWTGMGIVLWVMFPMTSTVLLPLCCIAPLAWHWTASRRLSWHRPSLVTASLILAAGYLLINTSWSLNPASAARTVVFAFIMVGSLHIVLSTLSDLPEPPLRAMASGALVGVLVAGIVLCIEVFSDQSLRRFLMRIVPALQPDLRHVTIEDGHLARLAPYLANANISALTLMFWPAALLVSRLDLPRKLKYAALMASVAMAATVLASEHASSQVALLGGGAVFALFCLRPKIAMPVVIAGWLAANLLVVPVASLLYVGEAYRAPWLPGSARHRVVIWHYTSEQIHKAPLFGAGISTARTLHDARDPHEQLAPGTPFALETHRHSHNAYLQVWYETGAVGAMIMLGVGLLVLRALRSFSTDVQPYLAATFAACALLVASAYSIWAPWFMASLALASVFAALGAALPRMPAPEEDSRRRLAGHHMRAWPARADGSNYGLANQRSGHLSDK
jgi:O-antigen ligase